MLLQGSHKHNKGQKGHHDKEGHSGHYADKGGHEKGHHEASGHHGEYNKGEKGNKAASVR